MVKTGSGDCVNMPLHGQFTVKSDPKITHSVYMLDCNRIHT